MRQGRRERWTIATAPAAVAAVHRRLRRLRRLRVRWLLLSRLLLLLLRLVSERLIPHVSFPLCLLLLAEIALLAVAITVARRQIHHRVRRRAVRQRLKTEHDHKSTINSSKGRYECVRGVEAARMGVRRWSSARAAGSSPPPVLPRLFTRASRRCRSDRSVDRSMPITHAPSYVEVRSRRERRRQWRWRWGGCERSGGGKGREGREGEEPAAGRCAGGAAAIGMGSAKRPRMRSCNARIDRIER